MHKLLHVAHGQIDLGGNTGGWLVLRNHLIFVPADRPYTLRTAKGTVVNVVHLRPADTIWPHEGCWTTAATTLAGEMVAFATRFGSGGDLQADQTGKRQYFKTLSNLCRHWFDGPRILFIPQAGSPDTRRVIEYVRDNLATATIKGASEAVELPQRTLHRRCEAEFGVGLRALIGEVRMIRAMELLLGSSQSVQTVAAHVGFASTPSFVAAFSRRFGKPPGQLMRSNRPSLKSN